MSESATIAEIAPAEPSTPGLRAKIGAALLFLRRIGVFLFVTWHLFFMAFRNPPDTWGDRLRSALGPKEKWGVVGDAAVKMDAITTFYGAFFGVEQGWTMFCGPIARSAPFPAVTITFNDDTEELILSDNEPRDMECYFRFGGERHRKFEDYLAAPSENGQYGEERSLWRAYAHHGVRRWRSANPADPRRPVRATVVSRRHYHTPPDKPPGTRDPMQTTILSEFSLPAGM